MKPLNYILKFKIKNKISLFYKEKKTLLPESSMLLFNMKKKLFVRFCQMLRIAFFEFVDTTGTVHQFHFSGEIRV